MLIFVEWTKGQTQRFVRKIFFPCQISINQSINHCSCFLCKSSGGRILGRIFAPPYEYNMMFNFWNPKFVQIVYNFSFPIMGQRSIETTYLTITGHRTCCPADIAFPRGSILPQPCWYNFQCSGIWLCLDCLESTNLSGNRTAFHCYSWNSTA